MIVDCLRRAELLKRALVENGDTVGDFESLF